tara:strand:- start:2367 stop:2756 length:390 start_codon:yes stop_codon:yes gene_type:complete
LKSKGGTKQTKENIMRTLNDYFISGRITDISTAGSTFVAVPDGGRIIKIMSVLQGAISGGNAAITFEIGGTAVTGAGFTVAHSGSAVGTMDGSVPTALNNVQEDGSIEMITDGNSTGAKSLDITFVIRR